MTGMYVSVDMPHVYEVSMYPEVLMHTKDEEPVLCAPNTAIILNIC